MTTQVTESLCAYPVAVASGEAYSCGGYVLHSCMFRAVVLLRCHMSKLEDASLQVRLCTRKSGEAFLSVCWSHTVLTVTPPLMSPLGANSRPPKKARLENEVRPYKSEFLYRCSPNYLVSQTGPSNIRMVVVTWNRDWSKKIENGFMVQLD